MDHNQTLADFDKDVGDREKLFVNQNLRKCLTEHDGHDFITWSGDWASEDPKGDLCFDDYMTIAVEGFKDYEKVNLDASTIKVSENT